MRQMTKEQARSFRERWQTIDTFIIEEIRNLSPELRLKQIAAAYQAGRAMRLTSEEVPFREWQHLREKFNAR